MTKHFGIILQEHRALAHLEQNDIENLTHVTKKYIAAIEDKNFHILPSPIYTKNFIRSYAALFGFEHSIAAQEYIDEFITWKHGDENKQWKSVSERVKKKRTWDLQNFMKKGVAVIMVTTAISYLAWEMKSMFTAPFLQIIYPEENIKTNDPSMTIAGKTEPEAQVLINNLEILGDEQGNFSKTIGLLPGINLVTISAKKKHSNEAKVTRQILFDDSTKEKELAQLR